MKQQAKAWLVAYLNPNGTYNLQIVSEQNPTIMGGQWVSQCMEGLGVDFADARRDLLSRIRQSLPREVARYSTDDDVREAKGFKRLRPPIPAMLSGTAAPARRARRPAAPPVGSLVGRRAR